MKVFEKGIGEVSLTKNDFVASGGEGSVYAKGSTAYKIYANPKKMIPVTKIKELSGITDDKVIRPLNVLLDPHSKEIGYTMRYLKDTHALCQVFTKSFKDRNNISQDTILELVRGMQQTVKNIHDQGILIVDLNEMNFLVDKNFKEVYFIDVDSYQTKSYPATALMESVRDRHTKTFNQGSDWFSFAVVSFQLFMGIHPYKGKIHSAQNYGLEERMINNISVFNSAVSIPKICPSFDVIPKVYRDWYSKVFEEGYRGAPPKDLVSAVVVSPVAVVNKVKGNDLFVIKDVKDFSDEVILYVESTTGYLVKTISGNVYNDNVIYKSTENSVYGFTSKNNYAMEAFINKSGLLEFYNVSLKKPVTVGNALTSATSIMSYGGKIFVQSESRILEIQFSGNDEMIAGPKIVGNVLEKATKMYDGVVIQNLLGHYFASMFPESGKCFQLQLDDLKDHKIVDAKFDTRVLMVIGSNSKGQYDKFIFKLNSDFTIKETRKIENISILSLNFVCLPNGVVAHINDKENLELFSIGAPQIKEIESDIISSDMKLYKNGTNVYFSKENTLYHLRTK